MKTRNRNLGSFTNYILYLHFLMSLLAILLLNGANNASAQDSLEYDGQSLEKNNTTTLSISGMASELTKPDLAVISIDVETANETAYSAFTSNLRLIDDILSSLKSNGIMENETRVSHYAINPNYNYSQSGNVLNIDGFTVTNTLKIQSMDLESIPAIVDLAVDAGATNVNNIIFEVSEKRLDALEDKLIGDAIANAGQKAKSASLAIGLDVMGIKSMEVKVDGINDTNSQPFKEQYMDSSAFSNESQKSLKPGEQEISVRVDIVYNIG